MKFLSAVICFFLFFSTPLFAAGRDSAPLSGTDPDEFIARVSGESATKFDLEAIAPQDEVMEFAICKAVAQAQKKGAEVMSVGDPKFTAPPKFVPGAARGANKQVPDDWADLKTTVWLTNPNPSGMPAFGVADKALACSHTWDWFRDADPVTKHPSIQTLTNVVFKGQTTADPALVNSVFANIMRIAAERLKCGSATQMAYEIMPSQYQPGGETFNSHGSKVTFERWTPTLCGREIAFLVGFWPATDGGTMFRVVFPFPAQAQR